MESYSLSCRKAERHPHSALNDGSTHLIPNIRWKIIYIYRRIANERAGVLVCPQQQNRSHKCGGTARLSLSRARIPAQTPQQHRNFETFIKNYCKLFTSSREPFENGRIWQSGSATRPPTAQDSESASKFETASQSRTQQQIFSFLPSDSCRTIVQDHRAAGNGWAVDRVAQELLPRCGLCRDRQADLPPLLWTRAGEAEEKGEGQEEAQPEERSKQQEHEAGGDGGVQRGGITCGRV